MTTKYGSQRERRTPPHVSLGVLRRAVHLTLDDVCARVSEVLDGDRELTRGALSAIENGHRGASPDVLEALEIAYGLDAGAIAVNYEPRRREVAKVAS